MATSRSLLPLYTLLRQTLTFPQFSILFKLSKVQILKNMKNKNLIAIDVDLAKLTHSVQETLHGGDCQPISMQNIMH